MASESDTSSSTIIYDYETANENENENANAPAQTSTRWSQVRLFREAHLEMPIQCVNWCIEKGLLSPGKECSLHLRLTCSSLRREGTPSWRCSVCKMDSSPLNGSVFSDTRISLGTVLMLALCYAYDETYESTTRACIFSPEMSGPNDQTIANWFEFFRDLIATTVSEYPVKLEVPA